MMEINKKELSVKQIELYLNSIDVIKGQCFVSPVNRGIDSKNYLVSVNKRNKFKYILKIYPESTGEDVEYEMEILNKLDSAFSKKYFPVVIKKCFYIEKNPSILLNYISGRILSKKDISLYLVKKIAKKQARMHCSLANFTPKHKKNRFSIFDFSFFNLYVNNNNPHFKIIQNEVGALKKESKLFKNIDFTKSIIHEDLSAENIILSKNNDINFIDFGESHKSEIISDIAITIKEIIISNKGVDFNLIRGYLNSYQKIIRLNKDEIMTLPFLLKRQTVFMLSYLLNKQEINKTTELKKKIAKETKILITLQKKDYPIRNFIKEYNYE